MATSGKSSSVAALLLLVAVLAGSCATGANAACNVTNTCNRNVTLVNVPGPKPIGNQLLQVVAFPGQTIPIVWPILHDVIIVVGGKTYILRIADIQALLKVNVNAIAKIEIVCNGTCGPNALTINVYANVNVLGLLKLQLLGHVCALLAI